MAQSYRIKIARGDQHFEAEGDKRFVLEMLKRFAPGMAGRITGSGSSVVSLPLVEPTGEVAKALSVREFIQGLNLKKQTDIVVAFGYYLEKVEGKSSFTPADVNKCYYDAKLEPSNTSQMFINNIKTGRMMEAKVPKGAQTKRKQYTLTQKGEAFVKQRFQGASPE